jgi:hypothetical protein
MHTPGSCAQCGPVSRLTPVLSPFRGCPRSFFGVFVFFVFPYCLFVLFVLFCLVVCVALNFGLWVFLPLAPRELFCLTFGLGLLSPPASVLSLRGAGGRFCFFWAEPLLSPPASFFLEVVWRRRERGEEGGGGERVKTTTIKRNKKQCVFFFFFFWRVFVICL